MRRKPLLHTVMSSLFIVCLIVLSIPAFSEYRFREFKNDREKFERYTDQADKSLTEQQWQDIIDNGKRELSAEWERAAENEIARYLRDGAVESEVRVSLEEARAGWESDLDRAEANAKGEWIVAREKLVFEKIDFTKLKETVKAAGEDNNINSIEAWDSYVKSAIAETESSWGERYLFPLSGFKSIGESLTGDVKSGFESELARLERSLRGRFEVERNGILYSARNSFISELYVDTESLRYKSEEQSAETSTDNVIKEVQSDLKSEEDKILTRNYNAEGGSVIDFSRMSDNWQDELKQLIRTGMEKWNSALEKLYSQMLNWKVSAENAYQSAEALWRKAAERLEAARLEWEKKLSKEINESLTQWTNQEDTLRNNIETARQNLDEYMGNLSKQWNDHSSGLVEIAINSAQVYKDAVENISWLEKMYKEAGNGTQGAFGVSGTQMAGTAEFFSILEGAERDSISSTINSKILSSGYNTIGSRYYTNGGVDPVTFTLIKVPVNFYIGSESISFCWDCTYNPPKEISDMSPWIDNAFYYDSGFYKTDFTGAVEKQDANGNWYITESYKVYVYMKRMTYSKKLNENFGMPVVDYGWFESDELVTSFDITNDVTRDSADYEKSSYYYYKTEWLRWNDIKTEFDGIAKDAEYYMHEYNMLGQDGGPGYLQKDQNNEGDPYLMTDAEFQLELANRDKSFWQQRLDIAKAVLDYAEDTKRESAETTEKNKTDAFNDMGLKKKAYDDSLASVKLIIDELKKLQGDKPPDALNDTNKGDWDAYYTSIEYLTEQYSLASEKLKAAEIKYSTIKRSIILLQNNENTEFLKKQISEIEKNIVETERDIYLKRTELFSVQMQREYSERTAEYANSYKDAVLEYERSKSLFTALQQIVKGEENETSLYEWGNAIRTSDVLKDVEYDTGLVDGIKKYSEILAGLVSEPAKRGDLSSFIRGIYFALQNRMTRDELIVKTLQNMNFDSKNFLKKTYTGDHTVYKDYAEISIEALQVVESAFEWASYNESRRNYDNIIGRLYGEFSGLRYNYSGDNRAYIVQYAACMYFADNFKGLTSQDWNSAVKRVQIDIDYNEQAADVHDDLARMGSDEITSEVAGYQTKASKGDMEAVAWLREYYKTGSGIAAIDYIRAFDNRAENNLSSYMALQQYVYENQGYFSTDQQYMKEHRWLEDIAGYLNSAVPIGSWGGEYTFDGLKNLDAGGMSVVLTAFENYIQSLEEAGRAVPEFISGAANELVSLKSMLDNQLFIKRYMSNDSSDEMKGTASDIYDRKSSAALINESVMGFIEGARNAIDAGAGEDYNVALSVLSLYEKLSGDEKKYLAENSDEKIKSVHSFVMELYWRRYAVEVAIMASDFSGMALSVTPEDFVSIKGVTGEIRNKLIAAVTPASDIRAFNRDYNDGKITDINKYISDFDISSERKANLLNYALICEYLNKGSGSSVTSTDPAFAEYRISKRFEDLPEEVRIYLASQYYYRDKFLNNGILKGGIKVYLERNFGEAGISSRVVDAVERYAGRLNAVSLFYNGDINRYADTLDSDASKYFLMYVNGESDAVLPGFEYGIYGDAELNASVNIEVGRITSALDSFCSSYTEVFKAQFKKSKAAMAGLSSADALKDFLAGVDGSSWRDGIFVVTEKVEAKVQDEEKEGTEYEDKNLILLSIYEIAGVWADTFDAETGLKSYLVQSSTRMERDGRVFSQSGIIDSMNSILSVFESLERSLKKNYKTDDVTEITAFMENTAQIYNLETQYTVLANGVFSFEKALEELVTIIEGESSSFISSETTVQRNFDGLIAGMFGMKSSIILKNASYDLLAENGKIDQLERNLETARIAHEAAKDEFAGKEGDLKRAQNIYGAKNIEYVNAMDMVSRSYRAYQDSELAYEKAYAKWEYANTPYLMNTETDAAQINTGENVTGDVVSFGNIPVPDAKENYDNIEKKFVKVKADYDKAVEAVNGQDTDVMINRDLDYSKDKTGFVKSTESYIRLSQVYAELAEDLEKYQRDQNTAWKTYSNAKSAITFYKSKIDQKDPALTEQEKRVLLELRDRVLAHILKYNSDGTDEIGKYINAITWYACAKRVDLYNTYISEADSQKNNVVKEIEGYQAQIVELDRQIANLEKNNYYGDNNSEIEKLRSVIIGLSMKIDECRLNVCKYDLQIAEYNDNKGVYIPDSDRYRLLSAQVQNDISTIYTEFMTNDCLKIIQEKYPLYVYQKKQYEHACYEVGRLHNPIKKSNWEDKRDLRKEKMNNAKSDYSPPLDSIRETLNVALTSRTDYQQKTAALNGMASVRNILDITNYLKQSKYSLSDYDLNIYDSNSLSLKINEEGLNISGLRKVEQRIDIDGAAVKAVVNTVWDEATKTNVRVIYLLDREGRGTGERYNINDESVVLKSGGILAENYLDGAVYDFYDNNYNILTVTAFLKNYANGQRQGYLANLKEYMYRPKENGGFDKKVVLQDLEQTYSVLQKYAVGFNHNNLNVAVDDKEYRQRSFEGYITVTREYVNNGAGESIQGLIISELMKQNVLLQKQLWKHQTEKLKEKKERWSDVVSYIMNRGMKEWRENFNDFKSRWNNWRFDARKMIADGEEWWKRAGAGMSLEMKLWMDETSKASSKEAAGRIYSDLETRINRYETDIKNRIPGSVNFDPGIDGILAEVMKNSPVDSIGVLKNSMNAVDTTAGFTNMLNLGLSGALSQKNEAQMKEYTDAMSIMSNLRVIDILNGIIDNFNKQLGDANKKVYEGLWKFATSTVLSEAPFKRKDDENRWSIRVCVESSLIGGDKYKVRLFEDYKYFVNETVFIKPLNGLNGKMIDFNDAKTYINLDADELDDYVGLEAEWLNREIEKVFKSGDENGKGGGLFSTHVTSEQDRLKDEFIKYYTEWKTGELMRNAKSYNKPIAHGAPSIAISINLGAQIIGTAVGGPTGAAVGQFAASVLTTGLDIAFGEISLQHAGAQFGTGFLSSGAGIFAPIVNGALKGIEYEDDGTLSWNYDDCKDGMISGVKEMGVRALTGNLPGLSDMAASWVETEGGWTDWGFDNDHWGDHIIAGIGGLLSATKLPGQSAQFGTELLRFMAYKLADGKGFEDMEDVDESKFNWNLFRGNASTIGSLLPQMISYATGGEQGHNPNSDKSSDPLQQAEKLLNALWVGIRQGYEEGGVAGAFASMPGAYIDFVFDSIAKQYDNTKKSWFAAGILGVFSAIDGIIGGVKSGWDWVSDNEIEKLEDDDSVRSQELMDKLKKYRDMISQKNEENKDLASENAKSGKWYTVFESTEDAIDYIQTKKELGLPLTSDDARMLAQTMWQNSNGQLAKEFAEFVKDNRDLFKGFKIEGLDVNSDDSIRNFANKVANGACFMNTIFMNIILSSKTDKVPASWGEMYVTAMEGGLLQNDGIKTTQYMNTQEGIQAWVDTLIGEEDKLKVTGYFQGDGMSSADIFNNIPGLADSGVLVSGGRFDNNHHSMMQFIEDGNWRIFDTGRPKQAGPRIYGDYFSQWYKPHNTNSYWILQ